MGCHALTYLLATGSKRLLNYRGWCALHTLQDSVGFHSGFRAIKQQESSTFNLDSRLFGMGRSTQPTYILVGSAHPTENYGRDSERDFYRTRYPLV